MMSGWRGAVAGATAWLAASAALAAVVPRVATPVSVIALAAAAIIGAMRDQPILAAPPDVAVDSGQPSLSDQTEL